MSRLDPALLNPQLQQLTPSPSVFQRQQQDAALADQRAQVQERLAQADALKLANQKARAAYNASSAIRGVLQNNPEASMQQLLSVGGPEGIPIIKDMLDQRKSAIEQTKAKLAFQADLTKEFADAFSLETDESKHPEIERGILQKHVQAGDLTTDQATQIMQQPPDKVAELRAHELQLQRTNKELDDAAKRHEADEAAFKNHAEGLKAGAEQGLAAEKTRRLQNNLPETVPTPTDFDKEVKSWIGSAASKKYPQNEAGYRDYLQDRQRQTGMDTALATERAKAGNDVRLTNVPPNLHKDVLDKVQKAEDENITAQQAGDDMKTFIDMARGGNKLAYSYAPTEGVLTFNTGRGVKRVNMAEIGSYGGAGSTLDRVKAFLGKAATGASIPADILNDMESLHSAVTGNAARAYQRKIQSINRTYGANFTASGSTNEAAPAGSGQKRRRYNPATNQLEDIQ